MQSSKSRTIGIDRQSTKDRIARNEFIAREWRHRSGLLIDFKTELCSIKQGIVLGIGFRDRSNCDIYMIVNEYTHDKLGRAYNIDEISITKVYSIEETILWKLEQEGKSGENKIPKNPT